MEGASNTIVFNTGTGIAINGESSIENQILPNTMFSNGGLGIDLGDDGPTPNDPLDADNGPNGLQNYPILNRVNSSGDETGVSGTLHSSPNTLFTLLFYSVGVCDDSGYGEGRNFHIGLEVLTDDFGYAEFHLSLGILLPEGYFVTASASDPDGNTSEFSPCAANRIPWNYYFPLVIR